MQLELLATVIAALAITVATVSADSTLERRIADPNNPGELINCPPHGGADDCHLEQPCSRIRLNYSKPEGGHYIWYNYDINNIPNGIEIEVEDSCTNFYGAGHLVTVMASQ
ncbi:hypothetical protein EV361DRAFT_270625 [Lentinula raphanica]|uniref:Uncharacterized protein n=1 Tax=Lentinula raphanica TaxID=153919 RepID=A0AA38UHN4_9AGAR|nr:hypothetical protein F5880DRAFT_1509167 [Lentinula raphanica]KAJ3841590.1 hypothetical protein F5878DRAFT_609825 [Lentinula raphanica]KAJ3970674.1 hypothetical protein EV361DRAFT_270625 [Lentinula raphanica]